MNEAAFWRFRALVRANRASLSRHCPIGAVVEAHGTACMAGIVCSGYGVANGFDGHDAAREFADDLAAYDRGHRFGKRMRRLFPSEET